MKQWGGLCWWMMALVAAASACGQELVIPNVDRGKGNTAGDAPADGTTGASGAPDAPPGKRLPIADEPLFTTFGGAGGDEAGGGPESPARGGGGSAGGRASGGFGGNAGTKGSAGSGGAKPSAGGAGSAGHFNAGGAGGDGGSSSVATTPPSLLFSEYVEGSGSFKALEIYALEPSSLEGCALETYFNGKLEPSRLALHGELGQGAVQVLCSSALAAAEPSLCDRSTSLTFNGDDALALNCGGIVLDVIGQIGVDPGDAWGGGATADHTLRRSCSVATGRSDGSQPFELDSEWVTLGVDTFSDLGTRVCPAP